MGQFPERQKLTARRAALYAELGIKPPDEDPVFPAIASSLSAVPSSLTVLQSILSSMKSKPNRDRIREILADGRVMTTAEIFEKMGQSTLNTTQSEVSRMVNETKELVRHGDGVRLRRPEDP